MLVHAFLIKYAEIALKGKNRYRFEDALVHQMEIALSKIEGDFEDARQLTFSCIGLKRRSHFPVSFFIYIYNADTGRSHHGRKTF